MKKGSTAAPVAPNGYCRITCGSCSCQPPPPPPSTRSPASPASPLCVCSDTPPDSSHTCSQQASCDLLCITACSPFLLFPSSTICPVTCIVSLFLDNSCMYCSPGKSLQPFAAHSYGYWTLCLGTLHSRQYTQMNSFCSAMQKGFGACSADFMTKTSSTNPNGFCASTCGRCKCNAASTRPTSPSSASAVNSPLASPNSPENGPSSPRAAGVTSSAAAPAPPQPLSAAFVANCECSDVPPDGTTCASVVSLHHLFCPALLRENIIVT